MSRWSFSSFRFRALLMKEFIQMFRDRLTFGMMVGLPLMELLLFGYAINNDPHGLPTAVIVGDTGTFGRSIVRALENSDYFRVVAWADGPADAEEMIAKGEVLFVVDIPIDFSRRLQRGERPAILVEADATDPVATGNALGALAQLSRSALSHDLVGPLQVLQAGEGPFEVRVHRRYNQEGLTEYNIVPGLMGIILTMTMTMMTAVALTRELERGTMENLLATPVQPLEVMAGKIIPYILVGFFQVALILVAGALLFQIPMAGNFFVLSLCIGIFIAANLALGFTFSTFATNQMQAMQMSFLILLPSLLLSGFMFPFPGMPQWAQAIGEILPLTHFLRIVRGILLKGNGFLEVWPEVWPLLLFTLIITGVALRRYRQTLD